MSSSISGAPAQTRAQSGSTNSRSPCSTPGPRSSPGSLVVAARPPRPAGMVGRLGEAGRQLGESLLRRLPLGFVLVAVVLVAVLLTRHAQPQHMRAVADLLADNLLGVGRAGR